MTHTLPYSLAGIVALTALLCIRATAQDVDKILQKYATEQAVITNLSRKLVIKDEDGKLVAKSYVSTQKLLIGDLSPGLYNKEYIFQSYFNELEDFDAFALIPGKKGYTRSKETNSKTSHYEESNVLYDDTQETEISFNGLVPKSLIQANYTLRHTDLHIIPASYMQENMPVVQSVFEVTAPKYVQMKFVIRGTLAHQVQKAIEENKNTVTYTFKAANVPALENYDFVPSSDWYALHIIPYIVSYKMPGEEKTQVLGDPDHLYNYLYGFIRNLNTQEDENITQTAAAMTKGDKTQREKAAHIYQWVQQNIHYIAFEDSLEGYIPRQAAIIRSRKFGDCKDMASILVALCRKAGIDAYFTWIGTSAKPYTFEETPLPKVANHMICTAKIGDEWIFMDGTHPLIPFGTVPSNLQDKEALVGISEKEYKILTVPETDPLRSLITDTMFLTISDVQLKGKTVLHLHGYPSWDLQSQLFYRKNESRDKYVRSYLERGSNKYMQDSYEYAPSDTGSKPCTLTASFVLDNYLQKVGKEYYVNLNLKTHFEDNHVDSSRDIPEYFAYKDVEKDAVILDIPAGYHVSYLPPEAGGKVDGVWDYKLKYRQSGQKVILTKEYEIHAMSLPMESFTQHNKVVDDLNRQHNETVVLTAD